MTMQFARVGCVHQCADGKVVAWAESFDGGRDQLPAQNIDVKVGVPVVITSTIREGINNGTRGTVIGCHSACITVRVERCSSPPFL